MKAQVLESRPIREYALLVVAILASVLIHGGAGALLLGGARRFAVSISEART